MGWRPLCCVCPPSLLSSWSGGIRELEPPMATSNTRDLPGSLSGQLSHPRGAAAATAELLELVGQLVHRHHQELNSCLESWVQRVQAQPLHPLASCCCTSCESVNAPTAMQQAVEVQKMGPQFSLPKATLPPAVQQKPNHLDAVVCSEPLSGPLRHVTTLRHDHLVSEVVAGKGKKKKKPGRRKDELVQQRREPSMVQSQTWLERFTSNRKYEIGSGTLILLNAISIGWQTQHMALRAEADAANNRPLEVRAPTGFLVLQFLFSMFFAVELGLRWVCIGLIDFFRDNDVWWNVLDVLVVAFSFVDLFINLIVESGSHSEVLGNITVLRVLRVVRVVRVAKVIRMMRFFRELRMMVYSILGSMKSLAWVVLVLIMTFYVFGITFTAAATSALDTGEKWRAPETQELITHYGTLDRSILTLFMAMSGGQDWGMYYDALRELSAQYRALFLLYITFAIFAVVNIVTGVFVESAMQSNNTDREVIVLEEMESKKTYLKSMREVFDEMDEDDTGCITMEEFERKLNDQRVIAYFNALKLDVSDARTVFRLLDYDQSNEVNIDEFISGCYRLQGESRSLDMKIMQCEVQFLQESFIAFSQTMQEIHAMLQGRLNGAGSRPP
uniref:EF-hand domain-containing protein n=1 Tax=Alexandrium monilatum TaxID=311494 RepID=A0A7S4QXF7_9DINO